MVAVIAGALTSLLAGVVAVRPADGSIDDLADVPPGAPSRHAASMVIAPGPAGSSTPRRHPWNRSVGTLALEPGDLAANPRASRGGYVVMQPWEYRHIRALKRANPHLRVLMYKDVSATVSTACRASRAGACDRDQRILPAGVGYWWARAHHPGWFLRDARGRRLQWSDWPGLYPMDISRRGYQRTWARNVLSELRAHDWDGVMMDDTLTTLSHSVFGGRTSVAIPDDAAMYRATTSFLRHVARRIGRHGYLAMPNVTVFWDNWRSTLADWTRYVSGWENEYLVKWGLDAGSPRFGGADLRWKLAMLTWCARRGVPMLAVTYSNAGDVATQTYHRAAWLLAWNGHDGASMFVPAEDHVSFWLPHAVADIGRPAGPRRHVGGRDVLRRAYTRGVVALNAGASRRHVRLGGRYHRPSGRPVRAVTLAPRTAVILRR